LTSKLPSVMYIILYIRIYIYPEEKNSTIAIDMDLDVISLGFAKTWYMEKIEYYSWIILPVELQPQTCRKGLIYH
jgi:hypothetical protein